MILKISVRLIGGNYNIGSFEDILCNVKEGEEIFLRKYKIRASHIKWRNNKQKKKDWMWIYKTSQANFKRQRNKYYDFRYRNKRNRLLWFWR